MPVLQSKAVHSSYGRLTYIFNDVAHNTDKTSQRVLATTGINVHLLHAPDGSITSLQNGAYLQKQFHQSLKKAHNPNRQFQAQSVIISFSTDEFNTHNLKTQASQALQIVQGYTRKYFGDAQSVLAVQADGHGGKLHVHLLINAVKRNGRTVPTSRFSVFQMRSEINRYCSDNFQRITGRKWKNPFNKQHERKSISTRSSWENHLKEIIDSVKKEVSNVNDFLHNLASKGITVTSRGKEQRWTYHEVVQGKNGPKEMKIRAFYQRKDKETGQILSTRGLGQEYTKQALEAYWKQKERQQQKQPSPLAENHIRKKEKSHEQRQSNDEQLQKVRVLATEARLRSEQHQRAINRELTQLRQLTEDEKRRKQQRSRQKNGPADRGHTDQKRPVSTSQQKRSKEDARRKLEEKRRIARNNHEKDAGPDF